MGRVAQPDEGQVLVHPEPRRLPELPAQVVGAEPRRRGDVRRRDGLGVVLGDEPCRPDDLPVGGVDLLRHVLQDGAHPAAGQQQLLQHGPQHGRGVAVGPAVLLDHPLQQSFYFGLLGLGRLHDLHPGQKLPLPRQGLPHRLAHVLRPEKDRGPPARAEPVPGVMEGVGRNQQKIPHVQVINIVFHHVAAGPGLDVKQFVVGVPVVGRHIVPGGAQPALGVHPVDAGPRRPSWPFFHRLAPLRAPARKKAPAAGQGPVMYITF